MDNYQTQKTRSGLKVLVVKRPKNPKMIHLQYVLGIGSDLETGRQLEITHFLEHLFVSTSKNIRFKINSELLSRNNITYSPCRNKSTVMNSVFKTKLIFFFNLMVNAILVIVLKYI